MKTNKYIDLHVHSNFSDGELSPTEILDKANQYGLSAISITDHDSIFAYSDDLFARAAGMNIELIAGVELSTADYEGRYHILGLDIDWGKHDLKVVCERLESDRKKEAILTVNKLKKFGFRTRIETLISGRKTVTKGDISRLVVNNPINNNALLSEFGKIPSEGEFTERFLIKGKPAHTGLVKKMLPEEAIKLIHSTGGVAVLAHPSFNVLNGFKLSQLMDKFIKLGVDGFEAISIVFDRTDNDAEISHISEIEKYCKENNLIVTGGSDFHHDNEIVIGKFIDLGFKNYPLRVDYDLVKDLKNKSRVWKNRMI